MRILIVEDEEALADGLKFNFEEEGYEAVVAGDGPTALDRFGGSENAFDLVVLDLMLPGMSGYETCKAIREVDHHVPILVLSARGLSKDKSHAFDCGTDQYMTKPFALSELLSRVRNLLERRPPPRRSAASSEEGRLEEFEFGNVQVAFHKFEVAVAGKAHVLTTMELQLLRYFIENEGIVLSRAQILQDVWDQGTEVTTRTIDNFVMRLRKLIESNPAQPRHIVSVRGTGYRFVAAPDPVT